MERRHERDRQKDFQPVSAIIKSRLKTSVLRLAKIDVSGLRGAYSINKLCFTSYEAASFHALETIDARECLSN